MSGAAARIGGSLGSGYDASGEENEYKKDGRIEPTRIDSENSSGIPGFGQYN